MTVTYTPLMGSLRRVFVLVVAWVLSACTSASTADSGTDAARADVPALPDVPALDAPPIIDAGRDAGRDSATPDARADDAPDAWGMCGLVPQTGCGPRQACRLSERTMPPFVTPPDGPPACEPAGTHDEDTVTYCRGSMGEDLCQAGLYCQSWGTCVRYCDPAAPDPCPPIRGDARACTGVGPAGTWFCEWL